MKMYASLENIALQILSVIYEKYYSKNLNCINLFYLRILK